MVGEEAVFPTSLQNRLIFQDGSGHALESSAVKNVVHFDEHWTGFREADIQANEAIERTEAFLSADGQCDRFVPKGKDHI